MDQESSHVPLSGPNRGTYFCKGRPYIFATENPGGPIIMADHISRDRPTVVLTIWAKSSNFLHFK